MFIFLLDISMNFMYKWVVVLTLHFYYPYKVINTFSKVIQSDTSFIHISTSNLHYNRLHYFAECSFIMYRTGSTRWYLSTVAVTLRWETNWDFIEYAWPLAQPFVCLYTFLWNHSYYPYLCRMREIIVKE